MARGEFSGFSPKGEALSEDSAEANFGRVLLRLDNLHDRGCGIGFRLGCHSGELFLCEFREFVAAFDEEEALLLVLPDLRALLYLVAVAREALLAVGIGLQERGELRLVSGREFENQVQKNTSGEYPPTS